MSELKDFILPQEYAGILPRTQQQLASLSIAGCIDHGTRTGEGAYGWPTPLLLVEGRTSAPDTELKDNRGTRRHFYGPVLLGGDRWELNGTAWEFGVDIPADPALGPSVYVAHFENARVTLLDEPVEYTQSAFNSLAADFKATLE